jgi:hypothetical protein
VQLWRDAVTEGAKCPQGVDGMVALDEVLGLELVTAGRRRRIQTEVRQPFRPGAGDAGTDGEGVVGRLVGVVVPGAAYGDAGTGC